MDFLEKMFEYKYFGQIIFGTIAFLITLLIIIVLFGKKDEKKRKLEETKQLELNKNDEAFKTDNAEPIKAEVPVEEPTPVVITDEAKPIEAEFGLDQNSNQMNVSYNDITPGTDSDVKKEVEKMLDTAFDNATASSNNFKAQASEGDFEIFGAKQDVSPSVDVVEEPTPIAAQEPIVDVTSTPAMPDIVNNEPAMSFEPITNVNHSDETAPIDYNVVSNSETPVIEQPQNNVPNNEPVFNYDELTASIEKELNEISNQTAEVVTEQPKEEIPSTTSELPKQVNVTSISDNTPKFTPSAVFSSVYTKPENIPEEIKPVLEEEKTAEIPIISSETNEIPSVVIPVEEPKNVQPTVPNNPFGFEMPMKKEEAAQTPKVEETPTVVTPDFSSFSNESYDINK